MSKFFVGQRVRILFSRNWPELAGRQGVIVGRIDPGVAGMSQWFVAPDCWKSHRAPYPGISGANRFGPNENQLEPILPKGAAPSEFTFQQLMDELKRIEA